MKQGGFTLIELTIALGILGLIAAVGMPVSLNFYSNYIFSTEVSNAVRLLEQARSFSMNNKNQAAHGVRFEENKLITFLSAYNPDEKTNQIFKQSKSKLVGEPKEIIFANYLGSIESTQTIKLSDGYATKTISINEAGAISVE